MIDEPVHPGEILLEELLERGFTPADFATECGIDPDFLLDVCKRKRPIGEDLAKRLSDKLGTSLQLWLNLQQAYDAVRKTKDTN